MTFLGTPHLSVLDQDLIPRIHIGSWFNDIVSWITDNLQFILDFFHVILFSLNDWLATALSSVPAIILAVILAVIAWAARGWQLALFTLIGMLVIQGMRIWKESMDTLSLVVVSGIIAMLIAVPLGILASRSKLASQIIKPFMDFMQTLPAFVYLIPALFFFSVGTVPGMVATIIFAMPPGVRLTELGIRQVDSEMVEAGHAFGTKPMSILTRIQIPLAMPTIMAGVNQVIMLALSMVVIAGMAGAGGLGAIIYAGVANLQLAPGFEGGLAAVILAIFLDRVTAGLGDRSAVARAAKATAKKG